MCGEKCKFAELNLKIFALKVQRSGEIEVKKVGIRGCGPPPSLETSDQSRLDLLFF